MSSSVNDSDNKDEVQASQSDVGGGIGDWAQYPPVNHTIFLYPFNPDYISEELIRLRRAMTKRVHSSSMSYVG